MDLYLKSYSQSKFSQSSAFNKNQKKETVRGLTLSPSEGVFGGIRFHLSQRGWTRGSLTVGPLGPLVRFDQSPAPPSSSVRAGAGLRRSPSTNGGFPQDSEGRDRSASPGRSSQWSRGSWGQRGLPAASSAVDGGLWWIGVSGYGGSRSCLRGGWLRTVEGRRMGDGRS